MNSLKFICFGILFVVMATFSACESKPGSDSEAQGEDEYMGIAIKDTLEKGKMIAYSIPSPFQIPTVIKMLNIKYSEQLIGATSDRKKSYASTTEKALFLGIDIVDMGYCHFNEQYQSSIYYLSEIDHLMDDLGLSTQDQNDAFNRLEDNISDIDSISSIFSGIKKNFDSSFAIKGKEETGLLVLTGFYIEGLYMVVNIYENNAIRFALNRLSRESLDNVFLQQQMLLGNLIELLSQYKNDEVATLIDQLKDLYGEFESLKIEYKTDPVSNRITNVDFDTKHVKEIKNTVTKIRNKILCL